MRQEFAKKFYLSDVQDEVSRLMKKVKRGDEIDQGNMQYVAELDEKIQQI